ncbi:50S ribosome-binding GTPase/Dynamin family, putative [Leishmania donovani]|uniref:50S ribosome-binding GTPase/Dynamin family, putative n=1 Tax=Leishmania donovani TaxID=5661 RepID=A0A3S7WXN4_LEIDO|nr:50S ribosome-binding GTPase/Dynamin family, putative [Leishmania donovani]
MSPSPPLPTPKGPRTALPHGVLHLRPLLYVRASTFPRLLFLIHAGLRYLALLPYIPIHINIYIYIRSPRSVHTTVDARRRHSVRAAPPPTPAAVNHPGFFFLSPPSGVRAVRLSERVYVSTQSCLLCCRVGDVKVKKEETRQKKGIMQSTPCARLAAVPDGLLRSSRSLLQHCSRHKIVIPPLSAFAGDSAGSSTVSPSSSSPYKNEYEQHRRVSSAVAPFLPAESAAELQRALQLDAFREENDETLEKVWRDSKSHLRKQQRLVEEYGVEGAVRETLQPSTTSFREQLRQRPLDRAILQEIYLGLHGRRIERKLKRGVSWEHWITKGDGTAPVFNTSSKAQQTFAFGGHIQQVRCATHPQHFPIFLKHAAVRATPAATGGSGKRDRNAKQHQKQLQHRPPPQKLPSRLHPRHSLLPEVAFIGRTSSGKSSLVNAIVNAMITPYGHLRGTTNSLRFYNVANRLMLVDCPGYGHYDPMCTPAIDAENAVRAMRAYLKACAAPGAVQRMQQHRRYGKSVAVPHQTPNGKSGRPAHMDADAAETGDNETDDDHHRGGTEPLLLHQPRNVKRVFLCASAQGLQHLDYAYCDLLEAYRVPFAVVLTKTDAASIRFLARLTDYTRSQLVRYTQCNEILLTSSLRIAGIDKMQELLGSFAAADDPLHGATPDFSSIV